MDRQVKWTQNLRKDRGDSLGSNMDLNREVILTDAVFVFHLCVCCDSRVLIRRSGNTVFSCHRFMNEIKPFLKPSFINR